MLLFFLSSKMLERPYYYAGSFSSVTQNRVCNAKKSYNLWSPCLFTLGRGLLPHLNIKTWSTASMQLFRWGKIPLLHVNERSSADSLFHKGNTICYYTPWRVVSHLLPNTSIYCPRPLPHPPWPSAKLLDKTQTEGRTNRELEVLSFLLLHFLMDQT